MKHTYRLYMHGSKRRRPRATVKGFDAVTAFVKSIYNRKYTGKNTPYYFSSTKGVGWGRYRLRRIPKEQNYFTK